MSHLPIEPEFQQAYDEIYTSLECSSLFDTRPELKRLVEFLAIPERVIQFKVLWQDDKGVLQVNRGYRVQYNSALGPYKGGLRFHPTVNLSILKFLGYEQTFKNALTGLNMGGAKGGSDFDPDGKSENEIRRFCQAFMAELSRHIGANTDVPAGDINVGGREIGYMFGQYKKIKNVFEGVLTGKGLNWGGSLIRPEATGYGLVYFVQRMINYHTNGKETLKGKTVLISGSGNVAQYAALKVLHYGGKVLSMSDSRGTFLAKSGTSFSEQDILKIASNKYERKRLSDVAEDFPNAEYHEGKRPWMLVNKIDVALPCATQNEVDQCDAEHLIQIGCKYVAEGSNMGSTLEAVHTFEKGLGDDKIWYGPSKAANCGGVAVSGLEMAQNSQRLTWTEEEVDKKLEAIMLNCFDVCVDTAKQYSKKAGKMPSLVDGANIAGFLKVAEATIDQGEFYY